MQRFPEKDWPDTPFIEGIEWFCQPLGWCLSTEKQEPKFFVSVLTDIDANRHYCACLCFNETVSITPSKPVDEEEENLTPGRPLIASTASTNTATITHHSIMYAPKCLVLVSRLDYVETFRNCLGTIYTVYIESLSYPLETLIGNILGCIQVSEKIDPTNNESAVKIFFAFFFLLRYLMPGVRKFDFQSEQVINKHFNHHYHHLYQSLEHRLAFYSSN